MTTFAALLPMLLLALFAFALAVNEHRGLGLVCLTVAGALVGHWAAPAVVLGVVDQVRERDPLTLAAACVVGLVLLVAVVALESDPAPSTAFLDV